MTDQNIPTQSLPERLTVPITGASAATFAALSALRRNRVFHPAGEAYEATLELRPGARDWSLPDLPNDPYRVVVRLSRGAGLPEPLPDVLGLAIKIPLTRPHRYEQDLLLASSGRLPGLRNLLVPAASFFRCTYSSVLPYRTPDGQQVLFGARADRSLTERRGDFGDLAAAALEGKLRFELLVADAAGPWQEIGSLLVEGPCDQETSRALRFNPWNTHPDLQPAGPLNTLRRSAYKASQRARPA